MKRMSKEESVLTGYPSIDRPQEKYHRLIPERDIPDVQNFYDFVFESNKDDLEYCALEYMNHGLTFLELKEMADALAGGLIDIGVNKGDTILIGLMNSPEVVITLLAINRIGAISKWFDVRAGEKDIEYYAKDSHCKYLIICDAIMHKIDLIRNELSIERLIVSDLTAIFLKKEIAAETKNNSDSFDNLNTISFNELLLNGKNVTLPKAPQDKENPAIMVLSSGTTGTPKIIVHSSRSIIEDARKTNHFDLRLEKGSRTLAVLPPCLGYDLGASILHPLSLGHTVILSPTFAPEILMQYAGQFDICLAIPLHYRYLAAHYSELSEPQKEQLKNVKFGISGGDNMPANEHKEIEKLLGFPIVNGYGNNESWAKLCLNPLKNPKYGTVGIPYYGETVIAYDNDTEEEQKYGEVGEICALCNTMFLYYEGNEEETNTVKRVHKDGKVWLHTGDFGFVDEDGYITLLGRLRRVIIRRAFKIAAATIENSILQHPWVKECVAVEVPDKDDEHAPMAYIVVEKEAVGKTESEIKDSILQRCKAELKEYEIPRHIQLVPELPYTQNGKYDFRKLEEIGKTYVEQLS